MVGEVRRSANYEGSIWDDDYIQSLTSPYTREKYVGEVEKLKSKVKIMIDEAIDEVHQLELIDNLQRLGLSKHFEDRIAKMLHNIYEAEDDEYTEKDLHVTSLKFRLLRQHGYHVPQEVFCSFMDDAGNFEAGVCEDVRGVVSLYEASYLSVEGESILDLAKELSVNHLRRRMEQISEGCVAEQVRHALQVPLHWRVERLEARWFIQAYESRSDANPILVELAKLDFNMVQATYQDELKLISRWYKETGLPEKLGFARHRLAECFLWTLGYVPEAHLGQSREILTKAAEFVTLIDDIYDLYGTLEELQLFTETVERVYYLEAIWFESGYVPTTTEYLNTAWISSGGPLVIFYGYFSSNPVNKEELQSLEQHPGIVRWPSMILRLADDLGTSSHEMKRGDVPKAIQCYMKETGCSEEDARKYVKDLIEAAFKRMNKELLMEKPLKSLGQTSLNLGRISLCIYQYGDGFALPQSETKQNLVSLVVHPIPLAE